MLYLKGKMDLLKRWGGDNTGDEDDDMRDDGEDDEDDDEDEDIAEDGRGPGDGRWTDDGQPQAGGQAAPIAQAVEE
nr:E3 ubiquitin-protein ligase UPL1-like [Tanacetum cinerariifolium]